MREKMFPIQGGRDKETDICRPAGYVPWGIAELAYQAYAKHYGTGQSLQRLAERGGFGWHELVTFLRGDNYPNEIKIPAVEIER